MAKISDVAAFFCEHYPHKSELSKTRLTKLVYLADWKSVQKRNKPLTEIQWYFHNFGPYVEDVMQAVQEDNRFTIEKLVNSYGDPKVLVKFKSGKFAMELSDEEKQIVEEVIDETRMMYWDRFIKHVYSTPPIAQSDRYQKLNLREFVH